MCFPPNWWSLCLPLQRSPQWVPLQGIWLQQTGQVCVHSKMIHICDWWLFFLVTLVMPTVHSLKGHMSRNQAPWGRPSHMSDKRFTNLDRSPKTEPIIHICLNMVWRNTYTATQTSEEKKTWWVKWLLMNECMNPFRFYRGEEDFGSQEAATDVLEPRFGYCLESPGYLKTTWRQTPTHTHSYGQICQLPIYLTCIFLDCGRNPGRPGESLYRHKENSTC